MSNINIMIGANIRKYRATRNYSMQQLADRMNAIGADNVSLQALGSWERGQRQISAQNVYFAAKALGCTVIELYNDDVLEENRHLTYNISSLTDNERKILTYCFKDWQGDTHALIEWCGMYMSAPPDVRGQMIDMAFQSYNEAIKHGLKMIAVPYIIHKRYLMDKWGELFGNC